MDKETALRRVWLLRLVLTMGLFLILDLVSPSAAGAAELPRDLKISDVQRVNFSRSDTSYRALFPDLNEDREKIEWLVQLYNRARASLGEEVSLYEAYPDIMPFFLNEVTFILDNSNSITMILNQGVSFYTDAPGKIRRVTSPDVSQELEQLALSYFVPAQGVKVNSWQFRMGEEVTVRSDWARGKEASILLMPSYRPVTIPSAPAPYPTPEAILLATVPVEHDQFNYTFTLEEQMGRKLDGSPGEVAPGAWNLVLVGNEETMLSITILPSEQQEPRAVVYDRGQVYTWTKTKGVTAGVPAHPADQPLLVSEAKWGSPVTHVSPNFLKDWLDIPVAEVEPGRYRLGDSDLGLTVLAGEDAARVNGTMLSLGGTLRKQGAAWQLPWPHLGNFFGYRVQWLGSETVVFLCHLDQLPTDLQTVLSTSKPAMALGQAVTLTISGQKLGLGTPKAYLDPTRGRIMVPLRAVVEALGGKVGWYPVQPEYAEIAAEDNYGLPPTGERINAYAEAVLGEKLWRLYLTPDNSGSIMVSLRELALTLGCELSWNGSLGRVDLVCGEL